jgi:hypothetical protein
MSLRAPGQRGFGEDGRHSPVGALPEPLVAGTPGRISPVGALFLGSPDQGFEGAVGLGTGREALTSAHYLRSNTVESLTFRTVQSLASSAEWGQQDQGRGGVAADVPAPQRAESQQRRNNATFLGPTQVSLLSCLSVVVRHASSAMRGAYCWFGGQVRACLLPVHCVQ